MENSPSQFIGERGMIERSQFVRLILQSLCSLGFSRAASTLESESGIRQDSPEYSSLAFQTLAGQWEGCVATVNSISDLDPDSKSAAQFLIWKEHFLELLGSKNGLLPAKKVLLEKISTLDLDRKKVHRLARALIDMEGAVGMEERGKRRMGLLMELVGLMPDWIRVLTKQLDSCFYHNSLREITLYEDHECSWEQIPCKCSQVYIWHRHHEKPIQVLSQVIQRLLTVLEDGTHESLIRWHQQVMSALSGYGWPTQILARSPALELNG